MCYTQLQKRINTKSIKLSLPTRIRRVLHADQRLSEFRLRTTGELILPAHLWQSHAPRHSLPATKSALLLPFLSDPQFRTGQVIFEQTAIEQVQPGSMGLVGRTFRTENQIESSITIPVRGIDRSRVVKRVQSDTAGPKPDSVTKLGRLRPADILVIPHGEQRTVDQIQIPVPVPVNQQAVVVPVVVLSPIPTLDRFSVFQAQRIAASQLQCVRLT